mmetsp:Transcript_27687/g.76188  ORF Transcript_27687/g.76188 Transcript_27687/m.76188 type:complete len:217 (-) Transcript_27687:95-745(-)
MGNICSNPEDKKPSLLQPPPSESETAVNGVDEGSSLQNTTPPTTLNDAAAAAINSIGNDVNNNHQQSDSAAAADQRQLQEEQQKQLAARQLEQARLDMIVQAAGRRMVAVRSARGSNAYYDQGFAAALSQHLEQTTKFQEHVERPLPAAHSTPVYERLSQNNNSDDELIKLVLGNSNGESPHSFFDRVVAEPLLQQAVPKPERMFAGVEPMVESLL